MRFQIGRFSVFTSEQEYQPSCLNSGGRDRAEHKKSLETFYNPCPNCQEELLPLIRQYSPSGRFLFADLAPRAVWKGRTLDEFLSD